MLSQNRQIFKRVKGRHRSFRICNRGHNLDKMTSWSVDWRVAWVTHSRCCISSRQVYRMSSRWKTGNDAKALRNSDDEDPLPHLGYAVPWGGQHRVPVVVL